jgi:hypothetical protein
VFTTFGTRLQSLLRVYSLCYAFTAFVAPLQPLLRLYSIFLRVYSIFLRVYCNMFEDDVSDTLSDEADEDLLGNYVYVFEYA